MEIWILKNIWSFIKYIWRIFCNFIKQHPCKTFTITYQNTDIPCIWHMGLQGKNKSMQIVGDFIITNLVGHGVQISGAILGKKNITRGTVTLKELDTTYHSSKYILPANKTTEARVVFIVQPPTAKEGKDYIEDFAIIDQFGNKQWFKKCRFIYC